MYTREEILNSYTKKDFPKSLFDESTLNNQNILFYSNSKPPSSSKEQDKFKLSQSYVLPWRILQQKNYHANNNQNKFEFIRGANFIPSTVKEPLIDIKTENFKYIYDKFSIPLEKKIIYLKNHNYILGPFNFEELQNMYKNKKYDSNFEFRTIDIFCFSEDDTFSFYPLKNLNEDNWADELNDSPLLEYTELFSKVKDLLEATKKRKVEINELNVEVDELRGSNEEKDSEINELRKKIETLNKELISKEKLLTQKDNQNNKEEDEKEIKKDEETKDKKEKTDLKENEKNIINKNDVDDEEEKEIVDEKKTEFKPKILDMGEEWEIAGKKKKKVEKVQEEPKGIIGLSSKKSGGIKNSADSLIKAPGSNKTKKNKFSGEELVDMLKPKKKDEQKDESEIPINEFKEVKGKGKKKNKKQFEHTDISLGFKYK